MSVRVSRDKILRRAAGYRRAGAPRVDAGKGAYPHRERRRRPSAVDLENGLQAGRERRPAMVDLHAEGGARDLVLRHVLQGEVGDDLEVSAAVRAAAHAIAAEDRVVPQVVFLG